MTETSYHLKIVQVDGDNNSIVIFSREILKKDLIKVKRAVREFD